MKQRIFTLRQTIEEGTEALREAGIEEAALDAWYLLEYTAGISRAAYYADPYRELDEGLALKYLGYIERRKKRIPLQHINKEQEFMGYSFYVNEHVLIPRQDTETLVEEAVELIREKQREASQRGSKSVFGENTSDGRLQVLDMCTGSGCILVSILKMCPEIQGKGCDISKDALEVARKNAERLDVKAEWVQSDLFTEFVENKPQFDVIVSNPPYIPTIDIEELQPEVRIHDPRIALDGKEDGLYFYRRMIEDSIFHIKTGGSLLFEIGFNQGEDVKGLMKNYGYENVEIKKDLSGLDRVVTGIYNGG